MLVLFETAAGYAIFKVSIFVMLLRVMCFAEVFVDLGLPLASQHS